MPFEIGICVLRICLDPPHRAYIYVRLDVHVQMAVPQVGNARPCTTWRKGLSACKQNMSIHMLQMVFHPTATASKHTSTYVLTAAQFDLRHVGLDNLGLSGMSHEASYLSARVIVVNLAQLSSAAPSELVTLVSKHQCLMAPSLLWGQRKCKES